MEKQKNRSHGTMATLPDFLREAVEQMIMVHIKYKDIVKFLRENGVRVSPSMVCRYAQSVIATIQQVEMAQKNFRMVMEEMEKCPNLDTTEGILRLMSHHVFQAISQLSEEDMSTVDPEKLMTQATALIRAAGYKKRIDQQNKTSVEAALDANQQLLTDVLKKSHPELYKQVMEALRQEKQKALEGQA